MKSIGYWVPEDPPASQNLFVYVLEHPSRQEAEKNWASFQADPEWKKVKAESEAQGPLVDHIDRYFMFCNVSLRKITASSPATAAQARVRFINCGDDATLLQAISTGQSS